MTTELELLRKLVSELYSTINTMTQTAQKDAQKALENFNLQLKIMQMEEDKQTDKMDEMPQPVEEEVVES